MSEHDQPIFKAPKNAPTWKGPQGLKELQRHLQTAMILELHTIPLYLYAAYSVKNDQLAAYKFLVVVRQEMLHLGLAGNILCAIGGTPKVYGPEYTPKYPVHIFYEDRVQLELKAATKDHVKTFMDLEAPIVPTMMRVMGNILPEYHSIGEFYESTMDGEELDKEYKSRGESIFNPDTIGKQFQTADGSWYDEDMTVIRDIESAKTALTLIIEQGEGSTGKAIKNTIQSHFEVFKELHELDLDCYPVVTNPSTEEFAENVPIHKMMLAFDAAYCYLLMTMERLWTYEGAMRGRLVSNNVMNLMLTIMRPISHFLVKQKVTDIMNAGPPFNLYTFKGVFGKTALRELQKLTHDAVAAFPNDINELQPIEEATNNLMDIGL
ncbi:hypothetical protein FRB96_006426 [Tulasnella sp. 330]|nr:hypothetical protein FRB96_006426 [Tulasnella sp. 330]KAG8870727.1 hypothetical protein FRB97_009429 [Tulasnella sp. 331]KAG8873138.1 hypothetical protein FRB98_009175 [Tulasnella sp. 332]